MTDEAGVYIRAGREFAGHGHVNHSIREYVRGTFHHTNTVENYFSIFKRGIIGNYQWVSAKHLKRYLGEFDFRYNTRDITDLERTPALSADTPEAIEVRDKVELLKGVLQWQLERDFNDRLRSIRHDLRQTGEALVQTQRSRRKIDDSMREEPLRFDAFTQRVDSLGPRIAGVKLRVGDAMANQRAFLQSIAVGELQAQKQRLDIYTVQARFALAAIYDLAATVGQASP